MLATNFTLKVDVHDNTSGRDGSATKYVWYEGNIPPKVVASDVPKEFFLAQSHPNPFNLETTIRYATPEPVHVNLVIYNMLGQLIATVVDRDKPAGYHEAVWNGRDSHGGPVASGVYFYRLKAGEFEAVRRMALVK